MLSNDLRHKNDSRKEILTLYSLNIQLYRIIIIMNMFS